MRRAATALMARSAEERAIPKGATSAATTFEVRREVLVAVARRWGAKTTHAAAIDVGSFPEPGDLGLTSALGAVYEGLLELEIAIEGRRARAVASESRRRAGAHFTSPEVAADLARRTLEPLVAKSGDVLALRICDPSMGSGVFLAAAAAFLAKVGRVPEREVIARSLFGIDRDPLAVEAARLALSTIAGDEASNRALAQNLVRGNAVVSPDGAPAELATEALDWERAFADVLGRGRGFDAVLGNPPWVAYAGRAAQPLSRDLHAYFRRRFTAFAKYRTLQGVFVARGVEALAPGGRLGFVLPTSMADLAGYAPVRRAHDTLAMADRNLVDYGADAFDGVFQPAMGLCSTRRDQAVEPAD
ncbi:MAG: SAM-dependent DNA methyltransferase [Polyangiaceae bacterium]|nr:SAM-dependent DNA methyltransferase [Polyangiaceae bacterium]